MQEAKNTQRSTVRLSYDGRVHKTFRGPKAEERFANEARVLKYLEARGCPFVPLLLEEYPERLELVTTNCGSRVEQISDSKLQELFAELETFGVRHDDPFLRNITYRPSDGRFCIIDFEFSEILEPVFVAEAGPSGRIARESAPHRVSWSGITDRGRFRDNNEDAFLVAMLHKNGLSYLGRMGDTDIGENEFLFAVSDGMGGQKSGEFASRIATQKLSLQLPRHFGMLPRGVQSYSEMVLRQLFESIHQELLSLGKYDLSCQEMGATLTLIWYRQSHIYFAHVGDSRLYRLPMEGPMIQVSDDHSHVGWLKRQGKINEREAREHPRRSVLSQCLGAGHRYLHPQFGSLPVEAGDTFLLCTDGVNEGLWDRRIEELIKHPPARWATTPTADRLVLSAIEESGRDNASAIIVSFGN